MGWFENQLEERREADQQLLEDSFVKIAGVVMGKRSAERISDNRIITKNALDEVLKYYHYKPSDMPDNLSSTEDPLDFCLRPYGLMYRSVQLTEGWYRDAYGPMLGYRKKDGIPVALLPGRIHGYVFTDPQTGRQVRLTKTNAGIFDTNALCFYCPLPQRQIGIPDLFQYIQRCMTANDVFFLFAATLAVTLTGLLMPQITKILTGPVLASRQVNAVIGTAVCILCVSISTQLISSSRELIMKRIETKTSLGVQASMMMRILSLPTYFFREYSAGELKSRSMSVNQLCTLMLGVVITTGLTSVSSLLYIVQIFRFAPVLVFPSMVIIVITVVISSAVAFLQVRINRKYIEYAAKESGMSYSMITGVQKIRLAGAEKRIFSKWLNIYAEGANLVYNPPAFIRLNHVMITAVGLFSNIVLYFLAVDGEVDPSSWFAFTAAYGAVMGSFTALAETAVSAANIKPILDMAETFLKAEPETADGKEMIRRISGRIELEHVYFRYNEKAPYLFDDLSLKIKPGEYIAVVGRSGCGKSTLVRLLLGFEKPEKGAVYYDGKDLNSLDPGSLRKKIGTVMQDSGLFQGDIYSNIVISAPELTLDDAWEAAEKAGIADDIRAMPMGMHTFISERQGGISGGQKQRIMIARAIAPKPKLLLFDEATSALDNRTQRQVSEALDTMACTRIVIAHRLSTIRHCDRILVLDGGKIIEDGTYDELIELGGVFSELVKRQRMDQDAER